MNLSFFKAAKFGIETIFRIVVILILLSLFGTTNYFYNRWSASEATNTANQKVIERFTQKETIRERNPQGQERTVVPAVVIDYSLVRQVVGKELKEMERRWNISADERMNRLHSKTDITMTTHLSGLKIAKLDTIINVVTVMGTDSSRKAKVAHYNDGYNRLEIVDLGDTSMVTGKIRNKVSALAYSGPYPRFLRILPAVWKPRPIFTEVYSYNPLSGTDTVRSVITNRKITKRQSK